MIFVYIYIYILTGSVIKLPSWFDMPLNTTKPNQTKPIHIYLILFISINLPHSVDWGRGCRILQLNSLCGLKSLPQEVSWI